MACDPNTLLAQGAAFQALADRGLKICEAELIREWSGSATSVNQLLSDGAAFQACDDRMLKICQVQLLCNIAGGA